MTNYLQLLPIELLEKVLTQPKVCYTVLGCLDGITDFYGNFTDLDSALQLAKKKFYDNNPKEDDNIKTYRIVAKLGNYEEIPIYRSWHTFPVVVESLDDQLFDWDNAYKYEITSFGPVRYQNKAKKIAILGVNVLQLKSPLPEKMDLGYAEFNFDLNLIVKNSLRPS